VPQVQFLQGVPNLIIFQVLFNRFSIVSRIFWWLILRVGISQPFNFKEKWEKLHQVKFSSVDISFGVAISSGPIEIIWQEVWQEFLFSSVRKWGSPKQFKISLPATKKRFQDLKRFNKFFILFTWQPTFIKCTVYMKICNLRFAHAFASGSEKFCGADNTKLRKTFEHKVGVMGKRRDF